MARFFLETSEVVIEGGGVFSNGCLSGNGNSLRVEADTEIGYAGSTSISHPERFTPAPTKGELLDRVKFNVPLPECSQVPTYPAFSTGGNQPLWTVPPGNYPSIRINHPSELQGGGLYCLDGNFTIAGSSSLNIAPLGEKTGVTIFMRSGSFSTSGNSRVNLSAPPGTSNTFPALPGILIYLAPGNSGSIVLTGGSGSNYSGVVIAPDGLISAGGNSLGIGYNTAFIGNDVDIFGTANINIDYYPNSNYGSPTSIELSK
jgi:hypothetical protein